MTKLQEWAKRITYKAGWKIYAEGGSVPGVLRITVTFAGPNSNPVDGTERQISHARDVVLSRVRNVSDFVREVIVTIQELENHEMREWLRVDGEHWPGYLPHDPKAVMVPLRNTGAELRG